MTPWNTDRLSLLDVNNGSTTLTETIASPARSVYPDIEDDNSVDFEVNTVLAIDPKHTTTPTSSPMLPSAHINPDQPIIDVDDSQITPKASDMQLKSDVLERPRYVARRSLLNEPISFLSTTTSSASSTKSSTYLPSPVEDDVALGSIETETEVFPGWMQPNPAENTILGRSRFLDSRPKAARVLGANLRTLAIEQGGIPISALSSPVYDQPSAATIISPLHSSPVVDRNLASLTLSEIDSAVFPQPLYLHPSGRDNFTHQPMNTPAKLSKKPKFLPAPFDVPKAGGPFTRESVISTPYPSSGFTYLQPSIPVIDVNASTDNGSPEFKYLKSALKIPILVRNCNNYISAVGKVELSHSYSKADVKGVKDDHELVKSIVKEYRRLRGWRAIFSARCLIGVRVVLKPYTQGSSNADTECRCMLNDHYHPEHATLFMENCCTTLHTNSHVSSRFTRVIASKQNLEETLGLLLKRPSLGADNQICIAELRRLISETTFSDESGTHKGTLSLETIGGWNKSKIGIIAAGIMIASVLSTVLWILLGVSQEVSIVDKAFTPAIKPDEWTTNNAKGDWNGAGTRVEGGTTLGLLVLLLGWS